MRIWKLSHGKIKHFRGGLRDRLFERRILTIGEPTNWGTREGWQSDHFREIGLGDLVILSYGPVVVRLCVASGGVRPAAGFPGWLERKYVAAASAGLRAPYAGKRYNWAPNANSTCWEVPEPEWQVLERLILRPYFHLTVDGARAIARRAVPVPALADPAAAVREGRRKLVQHLRRERNRRIVALAKAHALQLGRLRCEACGFDFERTYGSVGSEFIEAHHKIPLSSVHPGHGGKTEISDLALLCANCHRMVHLTSPWLTARQLKSRLKRRGRRAPAQVPGGDSRTR